MKDKRKLVLALVSFLSTQFGSPVHAEGAQDESICGTDDIVYVRNYDGSVGVQRGVINSHHRPVGYHRRPGCTVTMISPTLALTARHCGAKVGDVIDFDYLELFGDRKSYNVEEVVESGRGGLDYAVLRLSGQPGLEFGFARLSLEGNLNGRKIVIIGHPEGRPKSLSVGTVVYSIGPWLGHVADTLGGSSGSAILSMSGGIIGVHTNGGCGSSSGNNSGVRMSSILEVSDVLTDVYERQSSREIVNSAGLCLDVHAPHMLRNRGRVQAWECNGQPQQQWFLRQDGSIRNSGGLCLDVHEPDQSKNGGRVQVWECNGQPNQKWSLVEGMLVSDTGLCLDIQKEDLRKNGAKVQVWQCNGQPQQRWNVPLKGILSGHGKCLDVHAPEMSQSGGRVQVWDCNGQPQQEWVLSDDGTIVNAGGGLCLDVHRPDAGKNGGRVQVWSCNGESNQRWSVIDGAFVNSAWGLCLDVQERHANKNGGKVQVWKCHYRKNQTWLIE